MSQPTTTPLGGSILACVNCARGKAKCDRKVPCTRCVSKKLVCQTRVPQRAPGRAALNKKINKPDDGSTNPNGGNMPPAGMHAVDTAAADAISSSVPFHNRSRTHSINVYNEWNHVPPFNHSRMSSNSPQSMPDIVSKDDPLLQFDAMLPPADDVALPYMQPNMFPTGDLFDFTTPQSIPSPMSQMPDLHTDMSPWDLSSNGSLATSLGTSLGTTVGNMSGEREKPWDSVMFSNTRSSSWTSLDRLGAADDDHGQTLEGWPLFQCNPITPSSACAPTAARHVRNLYALLKDGKMPADTSRPIDANLKVEPLLPSTREKLIAVLQRLFSEAQQLYGLQSRDIGVFDGLGVSVLVLPSPATLDCLFRAYISSYEPYYPFTPTAFLRINERMEDGNTILPSMLLLLMLAAGAMTSGVGEPHGQIAHGLLEICRISLRNLVEQNIKLASDPEVLQCALLLIVIAAWSGDKWQMDVAIYQKAMFLEMHLKAGVHEHRDAQIAWLESFNDLNQCWEAWREQEKANRITYSWLILDHEVCLFQDIPSTSFLSISSLNKPVPSPDSVWSAPTAKHWMQEAFSPGGGFSINLPWTLNEWVRWFTESGDANTPTPITPITLRLLLCHLQNQVMYLRFAIDGMKSRVQSPRGARHSSTVIHAAQMQEVQDMLHKWYDLAKICVGNKQASPAMHANMALYHLLMLNTLVSFPEIERAARENATPAANSPSRWKSAYHLENPREIYLHCGQVMRNLRAISEAARPSWQAAAVYRVALVSWMTSLASTDVDIGQRRGSLSGASVDSVLIDVVPAEHPSMTAFLNHHAGSPALSSPNGFSVPLDDPLGILRNYVRFLDAGVKTKFTLGIQRKLMTLARRWEG